MRPTLVISIAIIIAVIGLTGCEKYIYQDSYLPKSKIIIKGKEKDQKFLKNIDNKTVFVRSGDTLYSISRKSNIPLKSLIQANNLRPPYLLKANQELRIPGNAFYQVKKGDTLFRIAKIHDLSIYELCKINSIKSESKIYSGQILQLPLPIQKSIKITKKNVNISDNIDEISINNSNLNIKSNVNYKNKFLWPIRGKIISKFGSKGSGIHEDGIKIAVHEGEEVQASKKGEVIYSGNGLRGFGNLIIIKHKNGWITAYGHNQENLVKMGKMVKEGEIIAKAGSSGGAKTPQLYFQLRRGFETVDPQKFLL